MTRSACVIIYLSLLSMLPALGQISVEQNFKSLPLGPDTLCFRYLFESGDTLGYIVNSIDTINMKGQPLLTKSRTEFVLVICDSVTATGNYRLRFRLQSAKEQQTDSKDTNQRSGSPWIGREVLVVIDSLGKRLVTEVDNPKNYSVSPGGAFQPLLFPTLGESCGRQNQSWLFEDTTRLVENGIPSPIYKHATLWRVLDDADTLHRKFLQIQYTQTGLGMMEIKSSDVNLRLNATVAAFGKLSMDAVLKVPYHVFSTSENNLTITTPTGKETTGKHQVLVHAQLAEIRSRNPERRFRIRIEP